MTVTTMWWTLFSFVLLLSFAGVFYEILPPPRAAIPTGPLLRAARRLPVLGSLPWLMGMPTGGWPGVPARVGVPSSLWDLGCLALFASASAIYAIAGWYARGQK